VTNIPACLSLDCVGENGAQGETGRICKLPLAGRQWSHCATMFERRISNRPAIGHHSNTESL